MTELQTGPIFWILVAFLVVAVVTNAVVVGWREDGLGSALMFGGVVFCVIAVPVAALLIPGA